VAKSKDGEDGKTFNFKLKHHLLEKGADGEEIKSCSLEPDYSAIFVTKEPSGSQQKKALSALRQELAVSKDFGVVGSGPSTPCMKVSDAVTSVSAGPTTTSKNKRNNRAKTLIDDLLKGGYLGTGVDVSDDGWVWKL
jgi:hypothetical protein